MRRNRPLFFLPIIIAVSMVLGIFINLFFAPPAANRQDSFFLKNPKFNISTKLHEILNFIENTYVDSVDKTKLTETTINAMLTTLDPHSYYIPPQDFDAINEPLEGGFEGVGIEFRIKEDTVLVVATIPNGPSDKAGLKAGDRIVKVDTTEIASIGLNNTGVIRLLKGPRGTKVKLEIVRPGVSARKLVEIVRDKIPLFSVDAPYMIDEQIGYLKITRFSKSTHIEFLKATQNLKKQGMKKLIIDLRNNGGGVLQAAIKIADELLVSNQKIVYTTGRSRKREDYFSTNQGTLEATEVVVLINENSASASEILAGAIQDNDRGTVIGRRSFGKGLVQEQVQWPDGSALRLTVARYYTPTGRCIQKAYGENQDEYNAEAYERYENGELLSADSISIVDSLKFYTPKGKVVYGGGGIIPDVFVPIDTADGSDYLYELRYKGIIQTFALKYVDSERKKLNQTYPNILVFKQDFNSSAAFFDAFIHYATEQGVEEKKKEISVSKTHIERALKAAIAQSLFNDMGYYVLVNEYDKTVQKGLNVLK